MKTLIRSVLRPLASILLWLQQRVTIGAQIVLVSGQGVLLVRHRHRPGWHLPGGGILGSEDPAKCAVRELQQETGYQVVGMPSLLGLYPTASSRWISNYVAVFYSIYFEPPDRPASTIAIADCQWFPVDHLPPGASSFCRAMIYVVSQSVSSAQWKRIPSTE